jgi:prepilin-type N-terminal cleavage/methylation domain-containing protein
MFNKLFKAEGGFTLVELLVTIAILGVLFGIVTLTLSGVGSDAQQTVCDTETFVVQSAIDIYLAADATNTVADLAPAAVISGGTGGYRDYLRGDTTGTYTITSNVAAQGTCP